MVKRYEPTVYGAEMVDLDDGGYVTHADYAALEAAHADRLRWLTEARDELALLWGYESHEAREAAGRADYKPDSARHSAALYVQALRDRTALEAENARLRERIEQAPHDKLCGWEISYSPCDCWKSEL